MIKILFHYSKHIDKIKKSGCIKDVSFAKTNTYDMVLETCPELILDKVNIKKFNDFRKKNKLNIKKWVKSQNEDSYKSKYTNLKLKYKNFLLDEFFSKNKFVLAVDDKLSKGWIKWGMFPFLINWTGREFLKFKITKETAKKSFVLEQKYWSPFYSKKKFGVNSWKSGFNILKYPKMVKDIFGKYYLSIKRLSDYKKGEFEVPEFWIYGRVPFENCEKGELSEKEFGKFLKEREELKK